MDSRDDFRLRAYAAEKSLAELEAKVERLEKALQLIYDNAAECGNGCGMLAREALEEEQE